MAPRLDLTAIEIRHSTPNASFLRVSAPGGESVCLDSLDRDLPVDEIYGDPLAAD